MKTKLIFPALLFTGAALAWGLFTGLPTVPTETPLRPAPTEGTIVRTDAEEGDNQVKREAWFKAMHRAAPDVSWRNLEYQNQFQQHQVLSRQRKLSGGRSDCGTESFSEDSFQGEWRERGSRNQAGSVLITRFYAPTESIYTISDGGSLWRGDLEGTQWDVINQDLRFNDGLLELIEGPTGTRIVAAIGDRPHYSDDMGLTWTRASGVRANDNWAEVQDGLVVDQNGQTVIYLLSKPSYWVNVKLYRSLDLGETYEELYQFDSNFTNEMKMTRVKGTDRVMVVTLDQSPARLFEIDADGNLSPLGDLNALPLAGQRANLQAVQLPDSEDLRFFIYDENLQLWVSDDLGQEWTPRGTLPTRPWSVSLFVSEKNPDLLLYGEVECYRSPNGGNSFNRINGWAEYYDNVPLKLHADIMYFSEVVDYAGLDFILISNHGGLSITTDEAFTNSNIGMSGLNVSQYYDVATDPLDNRTIYAGSQDQGFQRARTTSEEGIVDFEQVISGDYGHTAFSENGQRLWTVYPGGWITYYPDPQYGYSTASYSLDSDDETVWIPPLVSGPYPERNEVYLAGGNPNGGQGSYLIRLSHQNGYISAEAIDYDFQSFSGGGTISYIAFSPLDPDLWYVSTTNGRFFYSTDAGVTWEQNVSFLAESHYLYGAAIHPSEVDRNTVYYGGSGYSNPGVYVSYDNGSTFTALDEGLPNTMVFELDGNEDDSMIFAATEAGPYVFNQEVATWYPLMTTCTPTQTYWSVEYLEASQTARFGTYGRGIWDLVIDNDPITTGTPEVASRPLKVYPNPSTGPLTVELPEIGENITLRVYDLQGRLVREQEVDPKLSRTDLDLSDLVGGTYEISILTRTERFQQRLVIQ
ncbi:MAG: T9SS type A sorting domain-containing protein [Bacteroidota bacterium]